MKKTIRIVALVVSFATVSSVYAGVAVEVTVNGEVEFNIANPANTSLGNIAVGDAARMTFLLDSDEFQDNMNFPTRAYEIDQASYSITLGPEFVGLESPFPAGGTPWFVIRDNDPAVDGFFVSDNEKFPNGVPTDESGGFGQFEAHVSMSYEGTVLSSLNILDAVGTYDFTGLTVFNYTIVDGPVDVIGVVFSDMAIRAVPEPDWVPLIFVGSWALIRHRRRCS